MNYTVKQIAKLLNVSPSSVRSRAKIRGIMPIKVKGLQMYDESILAEISIRKQHKGSLLAKEAESAIIERYLRTQDNNIAYLCSVFNVTKAMVHKIIDEHFARNAYEIIESKMNFPTFPLS